MTDDELDRALHAARPDTAADDAWATSADATRALARINAAVATTHPEPASRFRHPFRVAAIGVAAAAVLAAGSFTLAGLDQRPAPAPSSTRESPPTGPMTVGGRPQRIALTAYTGCDTMLAGLRANTAAQVTSYGLSGGAGVALNNLVPLPLGPVAPAAGDGLLGRPLNSPAYSTTNVQEAGVDEPDLVKTDGQRVVSVSNGVLRVVDAATRQLTGRLDLREYAGAAGAQLLLSGDRALLVLGGYPGSPGGWVGDAAPGLGPNLSPIPYPAGPTASTTFLLVDLASTPRVIGSLRADGRFVDARMVGGTARLVVSSAPSLTFPAPNLSSGAAAVAANQRVVRSAPLAAWQPTYDVSAGGVTTPHTVPCDAVSHPAHYTGTSLLTIYSVGLGAGIGTGEPVTLVADGATVYGSGASLYVASGGGNQKTEIHRFWVAGTGRPVYLGSGEVPGQLLDSYSMSEYAGSLRVVTTTGLYAGQSSTSVYVLAADTLRIQGHVDGLGQQQSVRAVRFAGPYGYVVTFRSVDPLYVLDLRTPSRPSVAGQLEVTGYSDYLQLVGDGRLLGVGQSVDAQQRVAGLQVALFDVGDPAHPRRLSLVTRANTASETAMQPHAFLYWPATGTAVVPINSWEPAESGAALVVRRTGDELRTQGLIRNPLVSTVSTGDPGIQRSFVIGDDVWTLSASGLAVSGLQSLDRVAWIPFS